MSIQCGCDYTEWVGVAAAVLHRLFYGSCLAQRCPPGGCNQSHSWCAAAAPTSMQDLTLEQFGQLAWALQRQGEARDRGAAEQPQQPEQQQTEGQQ